TSQAPHRMERESFILNIGLIKIRNHCRGMPLLLFCSYCYYFSLTQIIPWNSRCQFREEIGSTSPSNLCPLCQSNFVTSLLTNENRFIPHIYIETCDINHKHIHT